MCYLCTRFVPTRGLTPNGADTRWFTIARGSFVTLTAGRINDQNNEDLQILGCEARSLCESRHHLRPNFFIVVKREHDIGAIGA